METTVAIMIADLTGYTAMTDVHGGASAAKLVSQYLQLVEKALTGSARLVQRVGDQVMIIGDHADDVAVTANKLNAGSREHHFLSIHAGLHYGSVFHENGNFFGSAINVTSRIMNTATNGQVLCSADLVRQVTHVSLGFKRIGNFRFKNVLNEVEVFELESGATENLFHVDPVCHMLVDPSKTDIILSFGGETFHFCSPACRDMFRSNPENFIDHEKR